MLNEVRNEADGSLKSISFSASAGWKQGQAQELFQQYLQLTPGSNISMQAVNSTTTKQGITTQRFAEYFKNIKVANGGFTVTGKDGMVGFMTGNYYSPAPSLTAVPTLTPSAAFAKALEFTSATKYKWQNPVEEAHIKKVYGKPDTTYLPKGQLVWVEDRRSGIKDHKLHLAYSFDIYAEEPLSRQLVYIDAATGSVLMTDQLLKNTASTGASRYSAIVPFQTAHTLGSYQLYDSTRGDGIQTVNMHNSTSYGAATDITSLTNTWPDVPANNIALDAHWGATQVYDYWLTQQGRHSWDDLDGILVQYVHYSTNYDNAYWDGAEMTYGDGSGLLAGGFTPLTSIDVTAHEIGHGVCQATCGLVYELESGAMNEGFSDCWAATIENWANPHETDAMPKSPWDIGEEISTEPLRSMNSPLLQGQPNTYGGVNWTNVATCTPTGGNDYCGVHNNSGLLNYWYYLLTMGGTGVNGIGNAYNVNALGWTKSGSILYNTELVLSSTATFMDCRIASINAATVMFGPCSPEVQSVTTAWYAVGVGPNYAPCYPQIAFTATLVRTSELAPTTTCPATKTITIGLQPSGPAIAGGIPVANLLIAPTTTAVLGVDYTLSATSVSFPIGSTATQFITLTVIDNGAVNDNKRIDLAYTVNALGSGAVVSAINDSMTIYIDNNDSVPQPGGTRYGTPTSGATVSCNFTSSFNGSQRRSRAQYLIYASEMAASGIVPGSPISQIAFNVLTKTSTAPFLNYTVSMANTALTDLYTAFAGGLTQVYTGNHTTNAGIDSIAFSTNFTWDGTSNVVVQLCYGMNAASASANDIVAGIQQDAFIIGDYSTSNSGSGTGCALGYNTGNRSTARPLMRFKQLVSPAVVETATGSTRIWNVRAGQEDYFYNPANAKIIAGMKGMNNNLGCVTATVSQQGNGMTPAVFSGINRSRKEITITPTINGSITTYDVTMYMSTAELAGVDPFSLFLLQTSTATDATVSTANSIVLTPTLIIGTGYVAFRATVTGGGRFMLVDGQLCTKPYAAITAAGPISFCLGNNVALNTITGAGLTYKWQLGGSLIPGATNASYTATLGGDYTVIVNQSVCDSVSLPVTITLDSAYAAPITGSHGVCIGQTTNLADITPSGVWTSLDPAVATVNAATGVVSGVTAGVTTISYSATNICGTASATYSMTVSVAAAIAPVTGTLAFCSGNTSLLSDATSGGVWSSGTPAVASINTLGTVSGAAGGTAIISYGYTNPLGCTAYSTAIVTVNAAPVTTTAPAGTYAICTGTMATINAPVVAGNTYQWQNTGGPISGATNSSYTTGTGGNYRVTITNLTGCTATSAIVIVTVDASAAVTPAVSILSAGGFNICTSTLAKTFTAAPSFGGSTPVYLWALNGTTVGGPGATYAYVPVNGDIVSCQLTSSLGCAIPSTATTSVVVTVNPFVSPVVSVTASPNDTVCTGDVVTYTAMPIWGGTAPAYLWTENGINVATGPSYIIPPHNGDIIICQLTSNYPCLITATAISLPFIMHVQSPAVNTVAVTAMAPATAAGATATFVASAPNAGGDAQYQWFINGTAVPGATTALFSTTALSNGQVVTCQVISSELCALPKTNMSNGFTVSITTAVDGVTDVSDLTLLPNPNNGTFTIHGSTGFAADEHIAISVVNMLGQEVYSSKAVTANSTVDEHVSLPAGIAPGTYMVAVTSGTQRRVFHITVGKQ